MFSKEIADKVISIISSESETLSTLSKHFHSCCSEPEQLSVLTSLSALLIDDILDPPQQIITVWLLHDAFPGTIKDNPFYKVLQFISQSSALKSNSYSQKLCDIISCLFSPDVQISDFAERSVHELLDPNFTIVDQSGPDMVNILFPHPRISPIIISKADPAATQITQHQLLKELLVDPSLWTDFDVPFCRQMPEILVPSNEELQYMNINSIEGTPFLFDDMQGLNNHNVARIFIQHAQDRELKELEIDSIMAEINSNPAIFKEFPKNTLKLDKMMEFNPRVGAIFKAEEAKTNPEIYKQYKKADITFPNIEFVKQAMIRCKPPQDFFPEFLSHSTKILSDTKDHNILKTKAKLICEMASLLHQSIPFDKDILLELHSLCIVLEQRGLSEASSLKSLLE